MLGTTIVDFSDDQSFDYEFHQYLIMSETTDGSQMLRYEAQSPIIGTTPYWLLYFLWHVFTDHVAVTMIQPATESRDMMTPIFTVLCDVKKEITEFVQFCRKNIPGGNVRPIRFKHTVYQCLVLQKSDMPLDLSTKKPALEQNEQNESL